MAGQDALTKVVSSIEQRIIRYSDSHKSAVERGDYEEQYIDFGAKQALKSLLSEVKNLLWLEIEYNRDDIKEVQDDN